MTPRIAFAGDRDLSVEVLSFLLDRGVRPEALLLAGCERASHAAELRALCPFLPDERVFVGRAFRRIGHRDQLQSLDLDYIVSIHYPYVLPRPVLAIPRHGALNLHPAFLPFNRGWHTPTWAIMENTPIGATLHFMSDLVDAGDIVHQKRLAVSSGDTADTLYQRLKRLELEVFQEAWPAIAEGRYQRTTPGLESGTFHRREDLFMPEVQRIALDETVVAGELVRRLRALTTNQLSEAAYFEACGRRYRIQVVVTEVQDDEAAGSELSHLSRHTGDHR